MRSRLLAADGRAAPALAEAWELAQSGDYRRAAWWHATGPFLAGRRARLLGGVRAAAGPGHPGGAAPPAERAGVR